MWNKRKDKITKKILVIVLYAFLVITIASVAVNLLSTDKTKGLFGYTIRLVVSSSMEPNIKVNSLNIIKLCNIDDINDQDIICFNYSQDIIHRVVEIAHNENGDTLLHTKGDANQYADSIEIDNDMLIGKVVYTFNGLAPYIEKYSIEPGNIDSASLARNIIFTFILFAAVICTVIWVINIVILLFRSFRNKDNFDNYYQRYMDEIDELVVYRELLKNIKDTNIKNTAETRFEYIFNKVAKTKALLEMQEIHSSIKELKKGIKNCYYIKSVGEELDKKEHENSNRSLVEVIKEAKNFSINKENKDDTEQ